MVKRVWTEAGEFGLKLEGSLGRTMKRRGFQALSIGRSKADDQILAARGKIEAALLEAELYAGGDGVVGPPHDVDGIVRCQLEVGGTGDLSRERANHTAGAEYECESEPGKKHGQLKDNDSGIPYGSEHRRLTGFKSGNASASAQLV